MQRSIIATSAIDVDDRVEVDRRGGADPVDEHPGELGEHVGAQAAELARPDLGLGPRPDHRPVVLVEVGERLEPGPQRHEALARRG